MPVDPNPNPPLATPEDAVAARARAPAAGTDERMSGLMVEVMRSAGHAGGGERIPEHATEHATIPLLTVPLPLEIALASFEKASVAMEGIAELRAKLAAEEKRHEETKVELRKLREENSSQRNRIRELEDTIAKLLAKISKLEEQLASQEARHTKEMKELKEKVASLEAQTTNAAKKERGIRQHHRNTFVAGQLATVFIERLGITFLGMEWKKHRRFVSNLDELRTAMKNAKKDSAPLDKYLADNCNGINEEDLCDVLYEAKECRNPGAHPVCLEPDHITGDCDCNPDPRDVEQAIERVVRDRSSRTVFSRVIVMADDLKRSLQHRRLLQPF